MTDDSNKKIVSINRQFDTAETTTVTLLVATSQLDPVV
jgi:hypothetical protein